MNERYKIIIHKIILFKIIILFNIIIAVPLILISTNKTILIG